MTKRISIITGQHLCHNPRVIKEAATLARVGYEVEVIGVWSNPDLKRRDQALLESVSFTFRPVADYTANPTARLIGRLKSKLAGIAYQSFGIETRWQLGPAAAALQKAAVESHADFFVAHSESAMVVAAHLCKEGRKVGVDMEDWFSEDLMPEARRKRPIKLLRNLENKLLNYGVHRTCTSHAMAKALALAYGCTAPEVVYNAFLWSDRKAIDGLVKDRCDHQLPSIHWYSQTLGPGRGLEDLFLALPLLKNKIEVHLRGNPVKGFVEGLCENLSSELQSRVYVHQTVTNEHLLSRIAEHDIGFAGEQVYCRNRDLTVTNKILHYLLAGLAVLASDTEGQCEIQKRSGSAVTLYRRGDALQLADRLNALLGDLSLLQQSKADALNAAKACFCWERQEPNLLASVSAALFNSTLHLCSL